MSNKIPSNKKELEVKYEKEIPDLFEKCHDMKSKKDKIRMKVNEIKKRMYVILNNINNNERTILEKEYTIRDGLVYKYKSNTIVNPFDLATKNYIVDRIVEETVSEYKEKIKDFFQILKEEKQNISIGENIREKEKVTSIQDKFTELGNGTYFVECAPLTEEYVRVRIYDEGLLERERKNLRRKDEDINSMKFYLSHKNYLEEVAEKKRKSLDEKIRKIEEILDIIREKFSKLLVVSKL